MKTPAFTCVVGLTILAARPARAQEGAPAPPEQPLPFPALAQGPEPVMTLGHWTREPGRPFLSIRGDLGYLYFKPRVSFGYGKPFYTWVGIDVVPSVTTQSGGGYAGPRLQLDWFELRAGARLVHAFGAQYLTPAPSFTIVNLDEFGGSTENYLDLEVEATAAIPAGPGSVLAAFMAESIQLVPKGFDVYEETLHVVAAPPQLYRARLGYALVLGREHTARLGPLVEDIELPDRQARVVRVGLTGSFAIDDHLAIMATVLVPVYSPDSLGLAGADYTELGVVYRWATGHTHAIPGQSNPTEAP
jgi:hypothetical protein